MALNFGIAGGPPPRKKSGLPPKVGGKPHMAVMIAAIPKGGPLQAGDDEDEPPSGGLPLPRAAGRNVAPPHARSRAPLASALDEDEPDEPVAGGGGGGEEHPILPEAVSYRSEQETCANCIHMQNGECERLHIPVSEGDGCNLFSDASGRDADESAEQYEPEEAGEEEAENEPAYR